LFADEALKDRLFDYKVATIVLAVVAGIAILFVIVLIRYFIFRQHTASQLNAVLLSFIIAIHNARLQFVTNSNCVAYLFHRVAAFIETFLILMSGTLTFTDV